MFGSLSGRCLGVIFVICVLALFFFPLAQGSFQATHGPTTTFRAKWAFLLLLFITVAAAFRVLAAVIRARLSTGFAWIHELHLHGLSALKQNAILRC
jgi:hypothetical protein